MHVHVATTEGEAKFWLEPEIEMARNYGLRQQMLTSALKLITERQQEIKDAWYQHFPGG